MAKRIRDTAYRNRAKRILKANPVCYICGKPIDLTLHYLDPMAGTADHVLAVYNGGTNEESNLRPAHRSCNRLKSTKPVASGVTRHSQQWL